MAMHVAALCYCNQYLTDGFVPRAVAVGLLDLSGIGMRQWMGELTGGGEDATWQMVVEDLVTAGLWEPDEGGWRIHDYHDYQPSREHIMKLRETRREVGRKGGKAKGKQVAKPPPSNDEARVKANAEAKSYPGPVPVPPVGTGGTEASPVEIPQASPTDRASRAVATPASITPIPTAQTFVAAYVDAYRGRAGHDPPSRVKGQVARHLREAFTDGVSADHIKAGLVEWFDANQHPATLPSFIEVAGRNGQPRNRTRQQQGRAQLIETSQALANWAASKEGGNHGTPRVDQAGGPPQRELPRPGTPT
jgi:hypothetical protein